MLKSHFWIEEWASIQCTWNDVFFQLITKCALCTNLSIEVIFGIVPQNQIRIRLYRQGSVRENTELKAKHPFFFSKLNETYRKGDHWPLITAFGLYCHRIIRWITILWHADCEVINFHTFSCCCLKVIRLYTITAPIKNIYTIIVQFRSDA